MRLKPFLQQAWSHLLKYFLPQTWSHLFAFSVFFKFCCLFQPVIVSFNRPGLGNLIKNTPSFIRSGYLETILHRPQLQCLVAPFLFIRFLFRSLVSSIFLGLSTAFKILHSFVCLHFNPSMQLRSRDNLFLECKRSAITICQISFEIFDVKQIDIPAKKLFFILSFIF